METGRSLSVVAPLVRRLRRRTGRRAARVLQQQPGRFRDHPGARAGQLRNPLHPRLCERDPIVRAVEHRAGNGSSQSASPVSRRALSCLRERRVAVFTAATGYTISGGRRGMVRVGRQEALRIGKRTGVLLALGEKGETQLVRSAPGRRNALRHSWETVRHIIRSDPSILHF